MPESRSGAEHAAVVRRLRSAGCVFAEDEAALLLAQADDAAALEAMVAQRVAGVPLEHILGWVEFCGLHIAVDDGVFVPRRRTELLVARAVELAAGLEQPVVVDLCCGCGALGVATATALAAVELHAADLDPAAVACARRNVEPLGGRVHHGDLYDALPGHLRGRTDLLLVNVPYVPTGAIELMPTEARDHEPRTALDGGPDGLDVARRVVHGAPSWLATGGHLVIETSGRQAPALLRAAVAAGLTARVESDEDSGATLVVGRCG